MCLNGVLRRRDHLADLRQRWYVQRMLSLKKFFGDEPEKPEPRMTPRAKAAIDGAGDLGVDRAKKVFLAVITNECCALEVLRGLKVDLSSLRSALEADSTSLLLDDALRIAEEERQRFCHAYLGTEHLMLAMIRCSPSVAELLKSEGVDLEIARQHVMRELDPNFRFE